ncbi:box C/D snoRNA protein 1 [Ricinus communis]|uniref:Box C/D snoRNA protein 1 n=1 Tax=Ricinus communis TaxID=3988 RepID=B9REI1_RICCO|nr:box C/D snoRNA protein 1 [Ricinus communis]EEF50184.1 conserved hypothetical protein [Ricinus communis]|eukprot:XP_002512150.1 box C/D snoRNA protein 1 [Ricinus communis]
MEQQQQKDPIEQQQPICEECKENPSKYKCPGCSLRSCSLPCVKAHKHRTGCSGKRNQTHFVPLSQFNDSLILSDYNLLEETKRVAESAQRMRTKLCAYPQFRLPAYLQSLRRAAASRRTKLIFLPSGMSKREKNQSRYNQRKKFIAWTVEWRFHTTDVVLLDHGVHEDRNLFSVIEQHLNPGPWNHQLRQFCEEQLDSLKFFIRKYPKGPKSPFCELDIKAPLRQQLANIVILENPIIHVFLPSHGCDFEVVKCMQSVTHRQETNNSASPKGVSFREEEIEESNGSSDPQIYDFTKNVMLSPLHEIPCHNMSEKSLDGSSDGSFLASMAADSNSQINSMGIEPLLFGDLDFGFDQALIDAYSGLIGQGNPDDFFDLEGELPKEEESERKHLSNSREVLLVQDELEEGEIAE